MLILEKIFKKIQKGGQYNIPEKIFTGVGARDIPKKERALLFLCSQVCGLRSGGGRWF